MVRHQAVKPHERYENFDNGTHSGIRAHGSMFLRELTNNQSSGTDTRINTIFYLHPRFIFSRLAQMCSAFTKYRFERLCLKFVSRAIVTDSGEVFIGYTTDSELDLSDITDRKLRLWFEASKGTYMGPLQSLRERQCLDLKLQPDEWYDISTNAQTVQKVFQGKAYVALWGGAASVSAFADLVLEYSVVMVDPQLSVRDILAMPNFGTTYTETSPALSGQNTAWKINFTTLPSEFAKPGLYSLNNRSVVGTDTSPFTKALRVGSEFIGAVVGTLGGSGALYLYNTISDFLLGNPTVTNSAAGANTFSFVFECASLLGQFVTGLFQLEGLPCEPHGLHNLPTYRKLMEQFVSENPGHEIVNGEIVHSLKYRTELFARQQCSLDEVCDALPFQKSLTLSGRDRVPPISGEDSDEEDSDGNWYSLKSVPVPETSLSTQKVISGSAPVDLTQGIPRLEPVTRRLTPVNPGYLTNPVDNTGSPSAGSVQERLIGKRH